MTKIRIWTANIGTIQLFETYMSRQDVLCVNGEELNVNKHHLAYNSNYFELFFFAEGCEKDGKIVIVPPLTVGHFKRMLETMNPENRPLDDDCIEGVYQLANKYMLIDVEAKCRKFLAEESKHLALFKYRLAHKYHFTHLKNEIMNSLKKKDFLKEEDFLDNMEEYAQLDGPARKALSDYLGQLFIRDRTEKKIAEVPAPNQAQPTPAPARSTSSGCVLQ